MTEQEEEYWDRVYVQPLFDKYKEVPTEYKYMLIEKDLNEQLGKSLAKYHVKGLHEESEHFIYSFDNAVAELSKTKKKNLYAKYCSKNGLAIDSKCKWLEEICKRYD